MNGREFWGALLLGWALGGLFMLSVMTAAQDDRPHPTHIAQGCNGAGGDLWAMDESDFPTQCENIERY